MPRLQKQDFKAKALQFALVRRIFPVMFVLKRETLQYLRNCIYFFVATFVFLPVFFSFFAEFGNVFFHVI